MRKASLAGLAAFALFVYVGAAQDPPAAASLTASESMIPMRDGARLYTQIYAPAGDASTGDGGVQRPPTSVPVPIILLRTPYGTGQLNAARIANSLVELAADRYIFVLQDIRGRFKSEGQFVMLRQPRDRSDAKAIDESTDTYDTIDWLLAHVPGHNGRV